MNALFLKLHTITYIYIMKRLIFNTFMSSLFPHTHAQKRYTSPFNGWGE